MVAWPSTARQASAARVTIADSSAVPSAAQTAPGPEPVGAHPLGESPFGVAALVGNVWQLTDVWRDAHTRAGMLRGGANYRPAGSK